MTCDKAVNSCSQILAFKISVKFGVDVLTSICLIIVGSLDRRVESQCDAILVISTSVPFVQVSLRPNFDCFRLYSWYQKYVTGSWLLSLRSISTIPP